MMLKSNFIMSHARHIIQKLVLISKTVNVFRWRVVSLSVEFCVTALCRDCTVD